MAFTLTALAVNPLLLPHPSLASWYGPARAECRSHLQLLSLILGSAPLSLSHPVICYQLRHALHSCFDLLLPLLNLLLPFVPFLLAVVPGLCVARDAWYNVFIRPLPIMRTCRGECRTGEQRMFAVVVVVLVTRACVCQHSCC